MRNRARFTALIWAMLGGAVISPAHPMGNFSINHYAKLRVGAGSIEVRYLIDMAEIPTFQAMRQFGIPSTTDDLSVSRYLSMEEKLLKKGLVLEIDGRQLQLKTTASQVKFADGAGGLPIMKIELTLSGAIPLAGAAQHLSYRDDNFPERAGWKEIVLDGNGVEVLHSSAPSTDRSLELTNYSSDPLNSPPQLVSASLDFKASPVVTQTNSRPAATTKKPLTAPRESAIVGELPRANAPVLPPSAVPKTSAHPQNTPRSRFTKLISTQTRLSPWVLLMAALIAASLGALHALEPGHGKTLVAAYLIGSRGTGRHAVFLGLIVTASHTAGVFLLGVATLYASRYIVPEQLYPWLGAISGVSVAGLGVFIFLRHLTGETGEHAHVSGKSHSHWFFSVKRTENNRQAAVSEAPLERALSLRELCMLGITGGIVPCPAALVVLLSAFSLHRIGFGLFLITAFSFGLAAVLVIVGLTMVYAKRAISRRARFGGAVRYLPLLSSAVMVAVGVGIVSSALASVPILHHLALTKQTLPLVTVVLLGLFLGMRHSTDPDHVVAISTIVSKQRSVKSSATIGLLWGLGHTITIFLVGSAIIIFGVVIPPRIGLGMEFCVALMLVLLGILNLTGLLNWIRNRDGRRAGVKEGTLWLAGGAAMFRNRSIGNLTLLQGIRPLAIGLVHGLAGSAAVALLVLSTIRSPLWSTAYLLVFGFGTMAGMMIMTAAMSMPLVYAGNRFREVTRYLIATSGVVSTAFGLFLVYQIGIVDGLFRAQVHWTPQ